MFLATSTLYLAVAAATPSLPPGKGKPIVQRMCSSCHTLNVVTAKRASKPQWAQLVDQMVARGAQGSDEDIQTLVSYLSRNFGSSAPPAEPLQGSGPKLINVNAATAKQLSFTFGLTPEEADAVIVFRQQHGRIKDWTALTKMPGVPASKFRDKKSQIRF